MAVASCANVYYGIGKPWATSGKEYPAGHVSGPEHIRLVGPGGAGKSTKDEEAVIRVRFELYMSLPMQKIETMRPLAAAVADIVAALSQQEMTALG